MPIVGRMEDLGRDDNPFTVDACRNFKERLAALVDQAAKVVQAPDNESITDELKEFFQSMEAADKRFIRLCAQAVSKATIRDHEVTRLLMANRFFTQSNRMVVLSMQALTQGFTFSEERIIS